MATIRKTQAQNLLSFDNSEQALNHSIGRGLFGSLWDVLVTSLGALTIVLTWAYHTVFLATKQQD